MKIRKHLSLAVSALLVLFANSDSYAQDAIPAKDMHDLRTQVLSTPPKKIRVKNSKNFPYTCDIAINLEKLQVKWAKDDWVPYERDLTINLDKIRIKNSTECPTTYGLVVDFPYHNYGFTATVVGYSSGDAILFTTSNFGVLRGGMHKDIKGATKKLLALADTLSTDAILTKDFSYPNNELVRIYFLTYKGPKVVEVMLSDLQSNRSKYSPLFKQTLDVLSKLQSSKDPD